MTHTDFDPAAYLQQCVFRDVRLGLDRTRTLLELLGSPQDRVPVVHIAGTNGKGSTSAFTAEILQAAGYKVGLFTSPFIIDFNERIQVNRQNIPQDDLYRIAKQVHDLGASMEDTPTSFEALTAVAMEYFAYTECDIAVIEVGLGGRLDSTNVLKHPLVSAIAPISKDHTAILGDTIEAIAHEKAGIIKEGVPVVSNVQLPDAMRVLKDTCEEKNTTLTVIDADAIQVKTEGIAQVMSYKTIQDARLKMVGTYQPTNAAVAIEVAYELQRQGWEITDADIVRGLEHTEWPGRFQIVQEKPYVIVDGGHNEQGAAVLAESLKTYFPEGRITFVMTVLADKDYDTMIESVAPLADSFFVAQPPYSDRALDTEVLAETLCKHGVEEVTACDSVGDAVRAAMEHVGEEGVVCCFGSLYSISHIMDVFA